MKTLTFTLIAVIIVGLVFFLNQETSNQLNTTKDQVVTKQFKHAQKALYNAEIEFQKTRNPETNEVPNNIRANELAFALTLPANEQTDRSQDWIHRGPINMGGRMLCVAFDVEDENHMLAGSASGGMWQSLNQGGTWEKVTPAIGEQSATCIAQDTRPGKTNTWYYGTGEILNTTERNVSTNVRTIGVGNGIFKSTD
ncbi:MAG: hypothetical protein GQ527_12040, partial [Bacteroidales bacterium]|nr:hypothetical protein [Bacteroidales bacterium]